MTDMLDDPAAMTPPQRRREIAAILARGVLRLRQCRENTHDSRLSRRANPASEGQGACSRPGRPRAVLEAGSYDAAAMGMMTLLQAIRRGPEGTLSLPRMLVEDRADRPFRAVQVCIKVGYHEPAWVKRVIDLARLYKIRHVMLHTAEAMWIGCTLESSNGVGETIRRKHLLWTKREMDDVIAYAKARGVWMFPHNETTPRPSIACTRAEDEPKRICGRILDRLNPRY